MPWVNVGEIEVELGITKQFPQLPGEGELFRLSHSYQASPYGKGVLYSRYDNEGVSGFVSVYPSRSPLILIMGIPLPFADAGLLNRRIEFSPSQRLQLVAGQPWRISLEVFTGGI